MSAAASPEPGATASGLEATPPATLRAAAIVVTAQAVVEAAAIAWRSELKGALRVVLVLIVLSQVLFARRMLRFSAGSVFAIFAFEIGALVAMISSGFALELRIVLAVAAVAAMVLIGASLSAFPTPDLPMNRGTT